jgi:DNA polymerase III subunit epsilon
MAEAPVTEAGFVSRYRERFKNTFNDQSSVDAVRFVALDCETTGLNPRTDRIVTIGTVAIVENEILLGDSFDALLKVSANTGAVTVHGVTRDESRSGLEEQQALELLLDHLKDGVIVGHHIRHDIATLNAACERQWGMTLLNRSVDTMTLTLHLERAGAFAGRPPIREFTLDALCAMFNIVPHGRHTASGDAFLTAQVFLCLLPLARRFGRAELGPLCESFETDEPS